jgi:hypothetical protein
MARRKAKAIEQVSEQLIAEEQSGEQSPSQGDIAEPGRQPYVKLDDPFEFKTVNTGSNKVRYGISHGAKAYFLLFDVNPNKDREGDSPHPVIEKLRADGWKWRPTPNGVLAWKKPWANADYSFAEDQQVRTYAAEIAAELGGPKIPGR